HGAGRPAVPVVACGARRHLYAAYAVAAHVGLHGRLYRPDDDCLGIAGGVSMDRIHIQPIPAFKDNYIWMFHDGSRAVVVDPGVAAPVLKALDEPRLGLSGVVAPTLSH